MAADQPVPQHLLRVSLEVSNYYAATIVDPLTGEDRMPPAKPAWLLEMEKCGAVVEVKLVPASGVSEPAKKVLFNGKDVGIESERRSLASVGREYLEDDGAYCMPLLSRVDATTFLPALADPIAVSRSLVEEPKAPPGATESASPPAIASPETSPNLNESLSVPATPLTDPLPRTPSQFFNFWNASSTFLGLRASNNATPSPAPSVNSDASPEILKMPGNPETLLPPSLSDKPPIAQPGASILTHQAITPSHAYRLSTLIIIAIISFLFGSLVRSLASPADFIYFTSTAVSDSALAQTASQGITGWREVRRLFEFKKGLFGWDVVVAVVRRPRP